MRKDLEYFNAKVRALEHGKEWPYDKRTLRQIDRVRKECEEWRADLSRKWNAPHPKCCCSKCFRQFNANRFIRSMPFLCPDCRWHVKMLATNRDVGRCLRET